MRQRQRQSEGRDIQYLRKQAQQNLQHHIHEVLPLEYNKTICLMKSNLKHVLQIGEASSDPKIKLEARRIANEIAKNILDQVTGGVICTRAFELAIQKQEQINTLKKLDERIEASTKEIEEEGLDETTTNGIF